jgi:hypothetical protein
MSATTGSEILRVLAKHGSLTTDELRASLPHLPQQTVRTTVVRLSHARHVTRSTSLRNGREVTKWTLGPEPYVERKKMSRTGRPEVKDTWTPKPWVHPIRARVLGLPAVSAIPDPIPKDPSDPLDV